ncbi:molybdopterin-binding protein [Novosphingobium umbonatum]|uniref:Molybdopterin-binding protein n=1 Tax=Novosphingobium umbonatum TaxID=1908524 RepID=A0A3S2Y7Q6_9SPHN|nr:molybdopterin-dependent oxidoreductase [Novosphingobium umbonatum]RVU05435.1 molybdopterin-binding protein [Novosphingobium umbonatum]
MITRRSMIVGGGLLLSGCDKLVRQPAVDGWVERAAGLHLPAQRLLVSRHALAREFSAREISPTFRANGNTMPEDDGWIAHANQGFSRWSLRVEGLVRRPLDIPLQALKTMPQRRQITRHDCVEGWSAIGQWMGPELRGILSLAGLLPQARYIVFHCADRTGEDPYYESIDLIDAFHPQTILAWSMNGQPLPVEHGAPLRLRVERQLGYKQAKYVTRIEARASLAGLYGGKGGYWEDVAGYQWYAGI